MCVNFLDFPHLNGASYHSHTCIRATLFVLACQNMFSGILGACMYPYMQSTGKEDKKCLAC